MSQYVPTSPTDVANLALLEIGAQPVNDIDALDSNSAEVCRAAFWPSVREVGRSHNWNCLKKRLSLTQLSFPQTSSSGCTSIGWNTGGPSSQPPYWQAGHQYNGGDLVTWGEAIYYALYTAVSSANFINDQTSGLWAQIYSAFICNPAGNAPSLYEWRFGYAIPSDFLLADELNGQSCRQGKGVGSLYELFIYERANADATVSVQGALFCNTPYADLKYTALIQDTTVWDSLFVNSVALLLASKIATAIRGDDGRMAAELKKRWAYVDLPTAKMKDAGESKPRRYDPTSESQYLASRYRSTNG